MPYRFVDHTADVAFELEGRSLEDLFLSAADATLATMVENPEDIVPRERRRLILESKEPDLLLLNFLQELIYYKDAESLFLRPSEVKISQTDDGWRLEGTLEGETIDPRRHRTLADVKAVTLHGLQVHPTPKGWCGFVLLDV